MLDVDGYILLKNVLSKEEINYGLSSINPNDDKKINYIEMKKFIDNIFFPTIVKNTDFVKEPHYTKFRFSNNNNSTDASLLHSDVYNNTCPIIHMPILTCLCYFDDTKMELVPSSHKINNFSLYSTRKTVDIYSGDILIFYSNLHHRGVNFEKQKNRRLLQVFDVFPTTKSFNELNEKIITVVSYNSKLMNIVNKISYHISKNPSIINTLNYIQYYLICNDLQYKITTMDIDNIYKKNFFITYEPGKHIIYNEHDNLENENLNINIICKDRNVMYLECKNHLKFFMLFIIFFILMFILYKYYSKK